MCSNAVSWLDAAFVYVGIKPTPGACVAAAAADGG
jgi:hypothetical protein